jgi:uncharacterized protein involved in outer membrane biogenesis
VNGRLIVAFLLGIPLVLAVGSTFLPRVGPHEIMRHQVARLAEEILPAPVVWGRVEISMEPPEIQIIDVTAGPAESSAPRWRVENIRLELAPAPLRRGLVRVEEVTLSKVTVEVVRGAGDAVGVPDAVPDQEISGENDPGLVVATNGEEKSLFDFVLHIEDGTLRVEDTRIDPPEILLFNKIQLRLDPEPGGSVVKGSARVGPEGRIDAVGRFSLDGDFELILSVEGLDLAILPRYLAGLESASGTLSGPISLRGKDGHVSAGKATLRAEQAQLEWESLAVDGPLELAVTLAPGPDGALRGRLAIDAKNASLAVQDAYRKAPGTSASVHGEFAVGPDGGFELGEFDLSIGKKAGAGS